MVKGDLADSSQVDIRHVLSGLTGVVVVLGSKQKKSVNNPYKPKLRHDGNGGLIIDYRPIQQTTSREYASQA